MAEGARLHLRLFIEGIEIPVISATVAATPNAPTVSTIQIIPTDSAFFFKPRTVVHLFFLDYIEHDSSQKKNPEAFQADALPPDSDYKLLFAGELMGLSFSKDPTSRSLVLQCQDFSNILDFTQQYYFNIGPDNADFDGRLAQLGGQTQASFTDIAETGPLSTMQNLITAGANSLSLPRSFPGLQGLLGGVIHLIENLTGVPVNGSIEGNAVNPFFIGYNLRNRLIDQLFAAADDRTSAKLFQLDVLNKMISQDLGQAGYRLSLREIINTILGYTYYSLVSNPAPLYDPNASSAISDESKKEATTSREVYDTQIKLLEEARTKIIKDSGRFGRPPSDFTPFYDLRLIDSNSKYFVASLPIVVDVDVGATSSDKGVGALERVIQQIKKARDRVPTNLDFGPADQLRKDRLRSLIFVPDIYFSPPPRCNVFFPELYSQFNFSRALLEEPTRLLVDTTHTLIDGGDPALKAMRLRAIGPNNIPAISGTDSAADGLLGLDPEKQKVKIMDHEIFTGIIMARKTLPDVLVYFTRSVLIQDKRASGVPPGITADLNVPYLRDATNFEYFKMRYQSRALSLSGRFNPFVVPGFPALVIDKLRAVREDVKGAEGLQADIESSLHVQTVKVQGTTSPTAPETSTVWKIDPAKPGTFQTGVHFLGYVASVQHAINQEGGNTFTELSNVHLHNEGTGFGQEGDKQDLTSASLEDFLFPPWFDELYLPENIGHKFYIPALGVGSIMLSDRGGGRVSVFKDLDPREVTEQTQTSVDFINNPVAINKEIATNEAAEKTLRAELSATKDIYGNMQVSIFKKGSTTSQTLQEVVGITNISFNPATEVPDKMAEIMDVIAVAYDQIRSQLKSGDLSFDPENKDSVVIPKRAKFDSFEKIIAESEHNIREIRFLRTETEALIARRDKLKEETAKGADKEIIKPRRLTNDVRRSVEALVSEYATRATAGGLVRGQTVSHFVNSFIHRDIVTMPQALGSQFAGSGEANRSGGFFSSAFGTTPIFNADLEVKSLTREEQPIKASDIPDPRKIRLDVVLKYRTEVARGAALG